MTLASPRESNESNQSSLSNSVLCNLCGVDDARVMFAAGVAQRNQIVRCNRCRLMYASPRQAVDHELMEEWPIDPNWDMAKELPQRYEKECLQVRDYASTRATLGELHPKRGALVEVGSSMGLLLQSFRNDRWDVLGIDPDPNGCRHATQVLGIPTKVGTLEAAKLPSASADAFVMLHVIEHVPDPVSTLREVHRVLKPGGTFVLETPRYDTLMFKLLGRRERSLGCDGHIYFFTNDTLARACEAAGFEMLQHAAVGRSLTLDRFAYNLGVVTRSRRAQSAMSVLSRKLSLQKVRMSLNLRDMTRVVLRKPK